MADLRVGDHVRIIDAPNTQWVRQWGYVPGQTYPTTEVQDEGRFVTLTGGDRNESICATQGATFERIAVLIPGARARITEQNTQTNLAMGTVVRLVRSISDDATWLVDSSPDLPAATIKRASATGRYRWAMSSILSALPTEETPMTTIAPALSVGTRVRILNVRPETHCLRVGSIATIQTAGETPALRGEHRRSGDQTSQWLSPNQFEVVVEETPADPYAVGTRHTVIGDTNSHRLPNGTIVTIIQDIDGYILGTTGSWSVGDPVPDWTASIDMSPARPSVRQFRKVDLEPVIEDAATAPLLPVITAVTTEMHDAVVAERDAAIKALADFKRRVAVVASREANKRDWCSEIDQVLASIDPDLKRSTIRTRVTRTIEVVVDLPEDNDGDSHTADCLKYALDLSADDLVDSADAEDSRVVSARWIGEATTETIIDDVVEGAPTRALGTSHDFEADPAGTQYIVLEGARRTTAGSASLNNRVPTVGSRVIAPDAAIDADGEVAVHYADGSSSQRMWIDPAYLALRA